MAFQRGPHIRDIFVGREEKENPKSKSNKKNKNGPTNRPVKIGEYKPRILSEDEIINVPVPRLAPNVPSFLDKSKPYIVGDKDTPIVLHPFSYDNDLELSDSDARLAVPGHTSNPVFNRAGAANVERSEVINGIVIPPPDYEEDDVYAEIRDRVDFNKPVHIHYGGEDYSKFLKDDDVAPTAKGGLTWRSEKPPQRKSVPLFDKRAKTEAKRGNKYQKREAKSKSNNTTKRNSVRDFSFADSKYGGKDEGHSSLKKQISTGNKGEDEIDTFLNTSNKSYESFLQARHETVSDYPNYNNPEITDSFAHPSSPLKVNSMWKRFTWRFKRQSSYTMAYE